MPVGQEADFGKVDQRARLEIDLHGRRYAPLAEAAGFKEGVHKWNEIERQKLRAELDAAYFVLYGLGREEVDYVLDQFQGVVKEDEYHDRPGPMRSAILETYDALQA